MFEPMTQINLYEFVQAIYFYREDASADTPSVDGMSFSPIWLIGKITTIVIFILSNKIYRKYHNNEFRF